MHQPLYFLPGLARHQLAAYDNGPLSPAILAARDLTDVFRDVGPGRYAAMEINRGPQALSGVLLCYHRAGTSEIPNLFGYYPDQQTWQRCAEGLWLGWETTAPPTAGDFARAKQFSGYQLELAGSAWQIPIVRRCDNDATSLPRTLRLVSGGVEEAIKTEYVRYWEESREVGQWFLGQAQATAWDQLRALELAIRALSLNYRFDRHEQNTFDVIDTENLLTVLGLSVDVPAAQAIEDAEKKTASP